MARMYRFARAGRIHAGPDQVHRRTVARPILRGCEPPAAGVPTEHVRTRRSCRRCAGLLGAVTSDE